MCVKQAISGTWVYATVLIFMVILIAYVTVTINYSASYELSQNIIKVIEQYEGYNDKSRLAIDKILSSGNHTVKGSCKTGGAGSATIGGRIGKQPDKEEKLSGTYDYCIKKTKKKTDGVEKYYYETTIFFSFNIPVLGDLFTFRIPGSTSGMRNVKDCTDCFKIRDS